MNYARITLVGCSGANINQLTQIVMKGKYINESWYIVFDGTSFYGVLGMEVEDTPNEDSDIEVVSGPYKEYPEEKIEQLNEGTNG